MKKKNLYRNVIGEYMKKIGKGLIIVVTVIFIIGIISLLNESNESELDSEKKVLKYLKSKYKNETIKDLSISVPGLHNISNACACIATCLFHDISFDIIKSGLKQ